MPMVNETGTRRRLQALANRGWAPSALAKHLRIAGTRVTPKLVNSLLISYAPVSEDTAYAVRCLYEALWITPPPETTPAERDAAASIRRRAATRGWAPPGAWDDDPHYPHHIDNPLADPAPGSWPWRPKVLSLSELQEEIKHLTDNYTSALEPALTQLGTNPGSYKQRLLRAVKDQGSRPELRDDKTLITMPA